MFPYSKRLFHNGLCMKHNSLIQSNRKGVVVCHIETKIVCCENLLIKVLLEAVAYAHIDAVHLALAMFHDVREAELITCLEAECFVRSL